MFRHPPHALRLGRGRREIVPARWRRLPTCLVHMQVQREPGRYHVDRAQQRVVEQRHQTVVAGHEAQVSLRIATRRIRQVADQRIRQEDRSIPGLDQTQAVLLLLAVEDELFAVTAEREKHVAAEQMRKTDIARDHAGRGGGGGLHRSRPGRPVRFGLREGYRRHAGIGSHHGQRAVDRIRRHHAGVVVKQQDNGGARLAHQPVPADDVTRTGWVAEHAHLESGHRHDIHRRRGSVVENQHLGREVRGERK
jgi:hypothetical protein